jgi:hypothetical protein
LIPKGLQMMAILTPTDLQSILDADTAMAEEQRIETSLLSWRLPIFAKISYGNLSVESKLFLAKYFLVESCEVIGRVSTNGDAGLHLQNFASELEASPCTELFGFRSKEAVAFAVRLIATTSGLAPEAAVGSVYLCTRMEIYFRMLSGFLNPDGTWLSSELQNQADARLPGKKLRKQKRINQVKLTYDLFLLNEENITVKQFLELERAIAKVPVLREHGDITELQGIGDRIDHLRHPAAHGYYGDLSSEGIFNALLYAIIFFSQQLTGGFHQRMDATWDRPMSDLPSSRCKLGTQT